MSPIEMGYYQRKAAWIQAVHPERLDIASEPHFLNIAHERASLATVHMPEVIGFLANNGADPVQLQAMHVSVEHPRRDARTTAWMQPAVGRVMLHKIFYPHVGVELPPDATEQQLDKANRYFLRELAHVLQVQQEPQPYETIKPILGKLMHRYSPYEIQARQFARRNADINFIKL